MVMTVSGGWKSKCTKGSKAVFTVFEAFSDKYCGSLPLGRLTVVCNGATGVGADILVLA